MKMFTNDYLLVMCILEDRVWH